MQIDHGSTEYQKMVSLRDEILRKPLGLSFNEEELEKEKSDILIGAFDDDRILGCCLLTENQPGTVQLRQMAVRSRQQGKGVGHSVMIFAENLARDKGYKRLIMHARDSAVGFYEKHGYVINGALFEEVGIPHFLMEKFL